MVGLIARIVYKYSIAKKLSSNILLRLLTLLRFFKILFW